MAGDDVGHLRPLQSEKRQVVTPLQRHRPWQTRLKVSIVDVAACSVDHKHQLPLTLRVRRPRHHQIVDDAAVVIHQ